MNWQKRPELMSQRDKGMMKARSQGNMETFCKSNEHKQQISLALLNCLLCDLKDSYTKPLVNRQAYKTHLPHRSLCWQVGKVQRSHDQRLMSMDVSYIQFSIICFLFNIHRCEPI